MRKLLSLVINELRVNFADPVALVFLLILPAVFTIILGVGLGGFESEVTLLLDVVDLDGSELSSHLVETLHELGAGTAVTPCVLTGDPDAQPEACGLSGEIEDAETLAATRLEGDITYAALIIPEDFAERLRAGENVRVAYRANAGFNAPTLIRQTVDAAVSRASGSVVAARMSLSAAQEVSDSVDAEAFFGRVYQAAEAAWESPPAVLEVEATLREETGPQTAAGFSQSAPGMACMFVMSNVLAIVESMVVARQNWTFQRLVVMPVPGWMTLAGKLLAYFIVGFVEFLLIVGLGALLGVNFGGNALAVVVLGIVYTLTVTALGLMLATFAQTRGQAGAMQTLFGIVLAPLGGAWWPLEIVPEFMNVFGHIVSPIAWAMDAFNDIIYYDKGLVDIFPYMGILLVYAAVFFAIGLWRFRYE